jgi:hypothetical protein
MKTYVELHSKVILRKTMLVFRWRKKYHISMVGIDNQERKHNNGPKESKEETSRLS